MGGAKITHNGLAILRSRSLASRGSATVARTHAVTRLFPHNSSTVSATKRSFAF
jgi:hypothetical protein